MKKAILFAGLLALASSQASAAPILLGSIFHDYGSDQGKVDPSGSDTLTAEAVIVSDRSSGRFSDVFDFSGVAGTVTGLELLLDFDGANDRGCFLFIFCGPSEDWAARIQGSSGSRTSDDLFVGLTSSPQAISLSSANDGLFTDVWAHSMNTRSLGVWFSESSFGSDSFSLRSATLNVFGEAPAISAATPVPAPGSVGLMGIGLAALGWMFRRRKASSVSA